MSSPKYRRDSAYCLVIAVQLVGLVVLNLVGFYPRSLYAKPTAPLHFLVKLRQAYVTTTGDPFFHASPMAAHPVGAWLQAFLYIELCVQLPLAAYLAYGLASPRRRTSPGVELATLVFACITFMGSVACCAELANMESRKLSANKKAWLLYGTYLPFAVLPAVMAADMCLRLLLRFQRPQPFYTKSRSY